MLKKVLIIIFILIVSLGGFFGFSLLKESRNRGVLKAKVYPPETVLEINGKSYYNDFGYFKIGLKPGHYLATFSLTDYCSLEKEINIEAGKTLDLNQVYLLPQKVKSEVLIGDKEINRFFLISSGNRLIYINNSGSWSVFDRNSKQEEKDFFKNKSLPESPPDFSYKKALVNFGKNNWQIIFIPKSLISSPISLTNDFKKVLSQSEFKEKQTSLNILQAEFPSQNEESDLIIIRTEDAIYLFDFLNDEIERLYQGKSSLFVTSGDNIYFIEESGVFSQISLAGKRTIENSLFSFNPQDLGKIKIIKGEKSKNFIVIDSTGKAYYLNFEKREDLPVLIAEGIEDGSFSFDEEKILLAGKGFVEVFGLKEKIKISEKLDFENSPCWFLDNNHMIFLQQDSLYVYDFASRKSFFIAKGVKNNNFFYDSSVNYIFYLSDDGIIKLSL